MKFKSSSVSISVIIPTVGRSSLFSAIDSVRHQTLEASEIIVIDDSINQDLAIDDSKLLIIKTGGGKGVSAARNLGLRFANSEWVAFLDDDDLWRQDKLELQIQSAIDLNLDLVLSGALINNSRRRPRIYLKIDMDPLELIYSPISALFGLSYLPTPSILVRKSITEKISFNIDLSAREDILFLHQVYSSGARMHQIEEALTLVSNQFRSGRARGSARDKTEQIVDWALFLRNKRLRLGAGFILGIVTRDALLSFRFKHLLLVFVHLMREVGRSMSHKRRL